MYPLYCVIYPWDQMPVKPKSAAVGGQGQIGTVLWRSQSEVRRVNFQSDERVFIESDGR